MQRCFILLFLLAASVGAQVSAVLSGTVTDQSGATVSGAAVAAKSVETGAVRGAVTDSEGHYRFFSLAAGQYEIRGGKSGFAEVIRSGVQLAVGQSATVDIALKVGERSQEITVTGDAPLVDVTTKDASGLVGEREVKDLPLNGEATMSC
jgi:hypothetical protein